MGWQTVNNSIYVRINGGEILVPIYFDWVPSVLTHVIPFIFARLIEFAFLHISNNFNFINKFKIEKHSGPPVEYLSNLYATWPLRGIHTQRTSKFYEWRLADPLSNFTTYLAKKAGDVAAAVVVCGKRETIRLDEMVPFQKNRMPFRRLSETLLTIVVVTSCEAIDESKKKSEIRFDDYTWTIQLLNRGW